MDHEFLTIKQAAERYVVSDITLRRLAREITRDDKHQFGECVRPGVSQLEELKRDNKPFEYELNTKLLGVRYKQRERESEEGSGEVGDARADVGSAAMSVLESTNDLLRDQLKVKDEQIRQLNESLRAMQQQQTATTMVLTRLTERLPLLTEAGEARVRGAMVKTKRAAKPVKKKTMARKKPPAKRPLTRSGGVFGRLFRRERATGVGGR